MFDRFGEMGTAAEINELAVNLRKEGDLDSIKVLAEENGIDVEIVELFTEGDILYICDNMTAAIGKIDIESKELKTAEIMDDWVSYVKARCFEDDNMAKAVRSKKKSLKGMMAALLKWSFKNQYKVDEEIKKAAGITVNRCTLGIPGMATARKIITEYYLEK